MGCSLNGQGADSGQRGRPATGPHGARAARAGSPGGAAIAPLRQANSASGVAVNGVAASGRAEPTAGRTAGSRADRV